MKQPPVHIGQTILSELNRQDQTIKWLADQLSIQRPNCYRILHSANISTDRLFVISNALQRDFFAEYSKNLTFKH